MELQTAAIQGLLSDYLEEAGDTFLRRKKITL
jgi:hypothetical protein